VLRFVPPLAALAHSAVDFDGDEQARVRPIAPLLDALRGLGVRIDGTGLPFRVQGTGSVAGGAVAIDASASSQFVSGLLLCAASFTDGLTVQHTGSALPSAPHIAMTVVMLRQAGVEVDDSVPNRWQVRAGAVAARHWEVEPDLTNAVAFLAAAVVSAGTVRITGWPATSVQPADNILDVFAKLNAVVTQTDSFLEVRGSAGYDGFDVDLRAVGELTPSVAALAALASPGSVSRLNGIAHLRGHETDRLAALSAEINRLGGNCAETPDGLVITATPLRPGVWRAYADHRMAMAQPPRHCRSSRSCGRGCWPTRSPAFEARRLRRVRRQSPIRQGIATADQDSSPARRRRGCHGGQCRPRSLGMCAGRPPRSPGHRHAGPRAGPHADRRRRRCRPGRRSVRSAGRPGPHRAPRAAANGVAAHRR
jgi:3-phosphoshikimate 1-carboxyvinyltransferase